MPPSDERAIFERARRINGDKRLCYLAEACADDRQRARAEALLRAHERDGDFLDSPAVSFSPPEHERPGDEIGPFRLVEQIGEGGFGIVFLAERREPIRRVVALKILKPGMDTREIVTRFEAERQALAMMEHPHIARVFNAGATPAGRPYFVMELVKGAPITRYCDEKRVGFRERLALFAEVCRAVQHAHQKGIIHRDLKPNNVLVASQDGRPTPKIIDFGVAKAVGARLTDQTLVTMLGGVIGTLEYMSPEQAELGANDVDTRADIYSLGVLLYELLTGTTPLSRERLRNTTITEAMRLIREEEPLRPSSRLGDSKIVSAAMAERQNAPPERLARQVCGELDWIVMKALDKDRNRRYQTANALARDVERYLNDEPVEACPPTAAYRLSKFLRRRRGAAAAVCAVLAVLAGGIAATCAGFLSARASQRQAEENFEIAKHAVDDYLNQITDDPDLKRSDFVALRKRLLESAVPLYQRLIEQKPGDAAQEASRGRAYGRLGELRRQMGEMAQASDDFEQMRLIFSKLAAEAPATPEYGAGIAESQSSLGMVMEKTGRPEEAEAAYRAALADWKKLAADFPTVREYRENQAAMHYKLGTFLSGLGKQNEAAAVYRDSLAIYEGLSADQAAPDDNEAERQRNRGELLACLGNRDEAERAFRAALLIQEKLATDFPTAPEYRENLAATRSILGLLLTAVRRRGEAEAFYRAALAVWEKLAADFPSAPEYRRNLATTRNKLGLLLAGMGKHDEAEAAYRAALPIYEQLAADFPAIPEYRYVLAHTLNNLGCLLDKQGKQIEAEAAFLASLAIYEKLAAAFPTAPAYGEHLAATRLSLGRLLTRLGKLDEAEPAFRASLAVWEKLAAAPEYRMRLAHTRLLLGQIHARKGQWKQAAASFAATIELDPKNERAAYLLGFILAEQGDLSEYRKFCNAMLSRSEPVADPMLAAAAAKACLLQPGGAAGAEPLGALVQAALSLDEKHALYTWVLFLKGLYDYRCGRFAEARTACRNSRARAPSDFAALLAGNQIVEAMSLYRQGAIGEARQSLAAADRLLDEQGPRPADGDLGEFWHDWLCCRILRREARKLADGPARMNAQE